MTDQWIDDVIARSLSMKRLIQLKQPKIQFEG